MLLRCSTNKIDFKTKCIINSAFRIVYLFLFLLNEVGDSVNGRWQTISHFQECTGLFIDNRKKHTLTVKKKMERRRRQTDGKKSSLILFSSVWLRLHGHHWAPFISIHLPIRNSALSQYVETFLLKNRIDTTKNADEVVHCMNDQKKGHIANVCVSVWVKKSDGERKKEWEFAWMISNIVVSTHLVPKCSLEYYYQQRLLLP